jgi:hypothetical protein
LSAARALLLACCLACTSTQNNDLRSGDVLFSGRLSSVPDQASGSDDLDGDGRDDCWIAMMSSGSGSGGTVLQVEAPCGAPRMEIDTTSSFGEFLSRANLPPAATPRLVEGIVDLLYGRAHLRDAAAIDDSFRLLLGEPPRWSADPPRLPPSQVIVLGEPAQIVAYYAHNHGALARAARCGDLDVYTTKHGVAVHDHSRNASSWIWIADQVEKLRWPSIERVTCGDGETVTIATREETLAIPVRRPSWP